MIISETAGTALHGEIEATSAARLPCYDKGQTQGAIKAHFPEHLTLHAGLLDRSLPRQQQQHGVARAKAICAAVPACVVVLDSAMCVLCASQAWLTWLGYSPEAVIGENIGRFMDPVSRRAFETQVWSTVRGGDAGPSRGWHFVASNGGVAAASITIACSMDEAGEVAFTTYVAAETAALARQDTNLLRLIELSPVPTLLRRLDNQAVLHANPAFYKLTGHEAGRLAGCEINDAAIWESRTLRLKLEHELSVTGTITSRDVCIQTAGAQRLVCALSASLVDIDGKSHGIFMFQDATERRRDEADLFEAIQAVMKDSTWFSRSVLEQLALVRSPPKTPAGTSGLAELTRRESEVLRLISIGQTDPDIAKLLGLTRSTVRNHVATLYSKIDVHSRSSAIVWARERGINLMASAAAPRAGGHAQGRSRAP